MHRDIRLHAGVWRSSGIASLRQLCCSISAVGLAALFVITETKGSAPVAPMSTLMNLALISFRLPSPIINCRSPTICSTSLCQIQCWSMSQISTRRSGRLSRNQAGGASLHFFPPPASPLEQHVYVPLGGLVQAKWWLALWAFMGVRHSFLRRTGWREVAAKNYAYLKTKTFYRSKRALKAALHSRFQRITFANRVMLRHSYRESALFAPIAALVAEVHGACPRPKRVDMLVI